MDNILFDFKDKLRTRQLQFPWADAEMLVLKAGTPLDEHGNVANGDTAIGIVAQDVPQDWGRFIARDGKFYGKCEVIVAGYVDLASAEASFGQAYTDALKEKLSDIVFVDESLGGGGGLPEIGEGDDGKVLTVDDGEAVWAEASGGGAPFIATFTQSGGSYSCNKTFAEVQEAYQHNVVYFNINGLNALATGVNVGGDTENYQASLMTTMQISGAWYLMQISISYYANTITPIQNAFSLTLAQ